MPRATPLPIPPTPPFSGYDSRILVRKIFGNQLVPVNVTTVVTWDTVVYDPLNEYDAGASAFVPSKSGLYYVYASVLNGPQALANLVTVLTIYVDAMETFKNSRHVSNLGTESIDIAGLLWLNSGEQLTIRYWHQSAGGQTIWADAVGTYLTVHRLSDI